MKIRPIMEAVGASLLILPYYLDFLFASNLGLYHHGFPVTNLIGGYFVDLLCVFFLVLVFLIAIQYLPQVLRRVLTGVFAGFLLWRIADIAINALSYMRYPIHSWANVRVVSCIAACVLSSALAYFFLRVPQTVVRLTRLVTAAFALTALWIVPHLVHVALVRESDAMNSAVNLPGTALGGSNRRIIWILFDELSYDQTFDHPAPGMKFPNFDQLRAGSVSFSRLAPTGFYTERIIPSLFLGRRIDEIRSTEKGDLWYKNEDQNRWLAFDPHATLFSIAQQNGWTTGIDGWYNPYCHLLASVLNTCSWQPYTVALMPTEAYGASEDKSILANAAVLPKKFLATLTNGRAVPSNTHAEDYRNVMGRTHALIENETIRFVFLHLPVPHPPGIYDRKKHMLRSRGTYLDNLVLADDTLGTLLQEIYGTPSASQTTVIVSSDHSWRVPIWRPQEDWSAEEELASGGGHFDDRPVLLIHFPGQTSGVDVNAALPELLEHDMIADMLRGQIRNSEDLATYLAQDRHR
jgi:hypothetical protein